MAVGIGQIRPVAHLPLILGMLRKLGSGSGHRETGCSPLILITSSPVVQESKPSSWLFSMDTMCSTR